MAKSEAAIVSNKKAFRDYNILDRYEAGIELKGTEVKSLRQHKANLNDSYARVDEGEMYLYHFHISPYDFGNINNHEPLRVKKLLLHKREIRKLLGKTAERGFSLIPLRVYFKRGKAKVELALAKGKLLYDKRRDMKKRDAEMEIRRAMGTKNERTRKHRFNDESD